MLKPQKGDLWALLIVLVIVGYFVLHYAAQLGLH